VPWKESRPVEERFKLVMACEAGEKPLAQICREFGVSRQTAYKWLRRYREDPDPVSLQERSRCPLFSPQATAVEVADLIEATRRRYPYWGPRKIRAWLCRQRPEMRWPAPSTIGGILKRRGLVQLRQRRRRTPPYTRPFAAVTAPNQVWCIDFKGHFRTGDGTRVYPLTVTDAFSRFILCCEIVLDPDEAAVRDILESVFRIYGLPEAIRSDNGAPFASTGPGGLSALGVWWIRLGIRHERIDPGKPQQNGRHERMHGTLKRETATPPAATIRGQQGRFNRFQRLFNDERPHEALDYAPPATRYVPSAKPFPEKLSRSDYPFDIERTLVDKHGFARWDGRKVFIGAALRYELVEMRPEGRGKWLVCFGPVVLGRYHPACNRRALLKLRSTKIARKVSAMFPV
jgi:transposase InsO family protein